MLIGIFKSNQKIVNVLTLLMVVAFWLPTLFVDSGYKLTNVLFSIHKWIDVTLSVLLITIQSVYLNRIVNEYKLTKNNSHLTSLIFLVLNCCFVFLLNFNQLIVANTFIIMAVHRLLKMYNVKSSFALLFNSGLLISIASIIYFPCVIYFVLMWIVLIYITTPVWRDFIISLLGFSLPFIYFVTYKYVFGSLDDLMVSDYLVNIFNVHFSQLSLFQKILSIFIVLIGLFAFAGLLQTLGKSVVRVRKMLIVVFLMFLLGIATLFLNQYDYMATFVMVSIPLSVIIANYFLNLKKQWFAELVFLCLMITIILSYFS